MRNLGNLAPDIINRRDGGAPPFAGLERLNAAGAGETFALRAKPGVML